MCGFMNVQSDSHESSSNFKASSMTCVFERLTRQGILVCLRIVVASKPNSIIWPTHDDMESIGQYILKDEFTTHQLMGLVLNSLSRTYDLLTPHPGNFLRLTISLTDGRSQSPALGLCTQILYRPISLRPAISYCYCSHYISPDSRQVVLDGRGAPGTIGRGFKLFSID